MAIDLSAVGWRLLPTMRWLRSPRCTTRPACVNGIPWVRPVSVMDRARIEGSLTLAFACTGTTGGGVSRI
jgi:hypothetical protein